MNETGGQRDKYLDYAVAERAHAGESVSGDVSIVQPFERGVLVAVIDGLGHGKDATAAARAAADVLAQHAGESVIRLMERCHQTLTKTRGAAVTLLSLHARTRHYEWLGVGNVEASHFRPNGGVGRRTDSVMLRGGIVGFQLPPLAASVVEVSAGDTVIFATDGINAAFADALNLQQAPQRIANAILARHFKGRDDGLVLVGRFREVGDE